MILLRSKQFHYKHIRIGGAVVPARFRRGFCDHLGEVALEPGHALLPEIFEHGEMAGLLRLGFVRASLERATPLFAQFGQRFGRLDVVAHPLVEIFQDDERRRGAHDAVGPAKREELVREVVSAWRHLRHTHRGPGLAQRGGPAHRIGAEVEGCGLRPAAEVDLDLRLGRGQSAEDRHAARRRAADALHVGDAGSHDAGHAGRRIEDLRDGIGNRGRLQVDQRAGAGLAEGLVIGHHRRDDGDRLRAVECDRLARERVESVREEQPACGGAVQRRGKRGEVRPAVVGRVLKIGDDLGRRGERLGGIGRVAKDDHAVLRRGRQRFDEREVELALAAFAAARGVPEDVDGDGGRQSLLRRLRRDGRGVEPDGAVAILLDAGELRGQFGQCDDDILGRFRVRLLRRDAPEGLGLLESPIAEAAEIRRGVGARVDLDHDVALADGFARHGQPERGVAVRSDRQRRRVGDAHRAGAVGGQGIDARFVEVALHVLDDAGVDAPARLGLEDHARLLLFDDDAVGHHAVDVDGVAADGGAVRQRKFEFALEDASVGIAEDEFRIDDGVQPLDGCLQRHPLEADRRVAVRRLHLQESLGRGRPSGQHRERHKQEMLIHCRPP